MDKEELTNSSEEYDIYRRLQEHLDKMPIGFPAVKSGADIRLLKHLFTPEEAKIAMFLRFGWERDLEPLDIIFERAKNTGISFKDLEKILDRMVQKGSIMFKKENEKKYYGNALLMVGMFEFQINKLTRSFIKDFHDYFEKGWLPESFRVKGAQLRVVPVEKSIEHEPIISSYDDIINLVKEAEEPVMVANCICKQLQDILENPCKVTDRREVCMAFGIPAKLFIDTERGRKISKEEAIEILRKNQEDGLVLQPDNSQKLSFVCSCCSCCCESLSKYLYLPNPAAITISNYYAEVDSDLCTSCETCVQVCPMNAIKIKSEGAFVKRKRCIGCGNCVSKCPSEAIQLYKKEREFVPYPTMDDFFDRVMQRKKSLKEKGL
jgi:electron transport complex protein RnfB